MSTTPRRRVLTRASALAAAVALLTACSGTDGTQTTTAAAAEDTTAAEAVTGGLLTWAIESEPTTLNPQLNGGAAAKHILRGLFDSYLLRTADGTYEPWLAASYEVSEDGLTTTLDLRDDVTFSNGEVLDAAAVVANFDLITSDSYATNPSGLSYLTGYEAVDEDTVQFTLSQPDSLFLEYLSSLNASPIAPESLTSAELEAGGTTIYGTGPFTLTEWTEGQQIVLAKRADYAWAPDAVATADGTAYLDEVTYRILPENSTRTGALSANQVDVATGIPALDVSLFDGVDGFVYQANLAAGSPYSLYLNVSQAPLDDVRVREALRLGIDLDSLLQATYLGEVTRAWSAISPTSPFYDSSYENSWSYDPDAANELLDEAGWTERDDEGYRTKDGVRLTLRDVTAAPYVRDNRDVLNEAIGAQLKTNLGVEYNYEPVDLGTEAERAEANTYEVFDNSYNATDIAGSFDVLYRTDGRIARGRFNDTALDELIETARTQLDVTERTATYAQIQQHIFDNVYQIPLYVSQDSVAYADSVQGITFDPASGFVWGAYTVWLDQD